MTTPFEAILNLDKFVHEPARLAILTALSGCESADFIFLRRITGLSDGNLSGHLSKLDDAGLIKVEKSFVQKRPNTELRISEAGRRAVHQYWAQIDKIRNDVQVWRE